MRIRALGIYASWIAPPLGLALTLGLALMGLDCVSAQSSRQVKVVLEVQQQGRDSRQGVQGGGGIIVQEKRGDTRVRGRGGVGVEDTTTRTTRTTGIFTVVQDGGTGTMLVAQEIPSPQLAYFYDYAVGKGYAAQGIAWQRVGTALTVRPTVLRDGQIRVRLTPQISYFTPGGGGSIEITEASTELIVPNGRRVQFGGATSGLHEVVRQILGYRERQSSAETSMALTATIQ
jgi:Bacterial type II and III secretion system protein